MKKTLLALSFLFALITAGNAQIVINEIMYNPPESGTDSTEYIEFLNNSNATVDMSNWVISQGVVYTFPAGTTVAPGAFVVVAGKASAFKSVFGFTPLQWTSGALTNSPGETIEIKDGNGTVIDNVTYVNAAPWPVAANGMGASLVLCDPNSDNSLPASWQACTTHTGVVVNTHEVLGNPNAPSGCGAPNQISATADTYVVPTGGTKTLNVLSNDVLPNPVMTFTVTTPAHGTLVKNSDNTVTFTATPGYCGADQFMYTVCDANDCSTGTVTLHINCYPPRSIGQVNGENATTGVSDSLNIICELQGTVYGPNYTPVTANKPSLSFTIIDNSGNGINVFSSSSQYGYTVTEKDIVKVWGKISQFNGLTEIDIDTLFKVSSNNPLLPPTVVTALGEATESQLIQIKNLHLATPAEWTTGTGTGGFNVHAVSDAHPMDTILIRIDKDIETYNSPAPPEPFDLTGIGGQFDSSNPYTSGYQVTPRNNKDISTLNATHDVDYSSQVRLTPNPAHEVLQVNSEVSFDRISIFGTDGRKVRTLENPNQSETISVANLPGGTYFIRFEKADTVWATRFVKL
jgi:hypothetical protein